MKADLDVDHYLRNAAFLCNGELVMGIYIHNTLSVSWRSSEHL